LALADIRAGMRMWRLWGALGLTEILQRYRRSILGPFWLTASMGVMVVALGILYGNLFKQDLSKFMPFFCVGLLAWNLISSIVNDAGGLFCSHEFFIKQIRLPYTMYVWKFLWARAIIFAHNFVIYLGVILYFRLWPGLPVVASVLGLLLIGLNGFLAATWLGMISARFRDVPQIIASATQVIFFLTPVLWQPELLGSRSYVVDWNPFFHLIEVVREPLLGHWPSGMNLAVVLLVTLVNLAFFLLFFPRFRSRIAYWV
jgi:ABC-2 type transport system permease protein/lipopolysaccharide transport system permease protein